MLQDHGAREKVDDLSQVISLDHADTWLIATSKPKWLWWWWCRVQLLINAKLRQKHMVHYKWMEIGYFRERLRNSIFNLSLCFICASREQVTRYKFSTLW